MSAAIAAVAIGGAAALGGAVMSSKAASKAADAQAQGQAGALAQQQKSLDFQMKQYNDSMEEVASLEDIFGPIRDNMSNYYKNISPEMFQLQGKESLEAQYKRSNESLDALFSNNGMFNSGQNASARAALEANREQAMGQNRQNAVNQYNQQEMNWLNYGTNQENNMRNVAIGQSANIANTYQGMGNTLAQGGSQMANIYGQNAANWGGLASAGMQMAGYGLSGAFGNKTTMDNGNLNYGPTLPGGQSGFYNYQGH